MSRSRVIVMAIMLALLGALIPIATMFYFSWTRAVHKEQERLALYAQRAIVRADISFGEARSALFAAERFGAGTPPCSAEHIAHMRALTINTRSIEEMGYFENGLLKCTSWGVTKGRVLQSTADLTAAEGIHLTLRMRPLVSQGNQKISLRYKAHNVLVDPVRFVDVIIDSGIQLALATDKGAVLGALNAPNPVLIKEIVARPGKGVNEDYLFATARDPGWIAVATEPKSQLLDNLRREQILLLPLGAAIAAFMVGIVVWLSRRRLSPLGELTIAVKKREFIVHYQPIIALKTGSCVGAEALVRWRRPDGSLIRPDFFVPLAEESGLILQITDQVIDAVLSDLSELLTLDPSLHIAINLCAEDIKTARFLPVLQKALKPTKIEARQIWLEATERGFMDINSARTTIEQARQDGYAVAIDDFGTGYSSLSYLQGFPLDALKIDKSFIDTIGTDAATCAVTPHIIDMAKALDLRIIAEGIENKFQADYLLARNVDFGQGWFYSKALPADEFIAYYGCQNPG